MKHPAAKVTMKELADDVPVVVKPSCSRAWPDDLRLWDLIDYHGRWATEEDVRELDRLVWGLLLEPWSARGFPPIPEESS